MSEHSKNVTIIGGSIGGLFAGLSLLRAGWDVHIYESAHRLDGRGAGIVTHEALLDVLADLGVSSVDDIGLRINTRKTFAAAGHSVRENDGNISGETGNVSATEVLAGDEIGSFDLSQLVTSWGRLYRVLRSAFPDDRYHSNHRLKNFEQNDPVVTAHFENGLSVDSSLLIAADGIRSTVRGLLEADAQPEYAGYVAWRGLVEQSQFDPEEVHSLIPYFTFCLPPGEQILAYPVAGDDDASSQSKIRYNVVWYRPAEQQTELLDLLTDTSGVCNGVSIAPNKIRPEVIAKMRAESDAILSPQHASLIARIEQPFIQPIYDVMSSSMVHGRVVMLGDAAYTARPHLGMGVTKVAEDARALVNALEAHAEVSLALSVFKEVRQPVNELIVNRSRQLGAYIQAKQHSEEERRYAEKHRGPEAVMRETATDDFLKAYLAQAGA